MFEKLRGQSRCLRVRRPTLQASSALGHGRVTHPCILASRLYQFVLWRDLLCQSCQCSSVPLPFMTAQREKYIQWGISESLLRGVNNPGLRGGDTLSQCLLRTYATSTVLGTVGETEQALNSVELITKQSGVQRS